LDIDYKVMVVRVVKGERVSPYFPCLTGKIQGNFEHLINLEILFTLKPAIGLTFPLNSLKK